MDKGQRSFFFLLISPSPSLPATQDAHSLTHIYIPIYLEGPVTLRDSSMW